MLFSNSYENQKVVVAANKLEMEYLEGFSLDKLENILFDTKLNFYNFKLILTLNGKGGSPVQRAMTINY